MRILCYSIETEENNNDSASNALRLFFLKKFNKNWKENNITCARTHFELSAQLICFCLSASIIFFTKKIVILTFETFTVHWSVIGFFMHVESNWIYFSCLLTNLRLQVKPFIQQYIKMPHIQIFAQRHFESTDRRNLIFFFEFASRILRSDVLCIMYTTTTATRSQSVILYFIHEERVRRIVQFQSVDLSSFFSPFFSQRVNTQKIKNIGWRD